MVQGRHLTIEERWQKVQEEIHSADNRQYTAERLGREPTYDELCLHWETQGGRSGFEQRYPWM